MIDDDERRDAIRYQIVRKMSPREFREEWNGALLGPYSGSFDDRIEDLALKFLGRTFEQEFERRKSLDIAEATF